MHVVDHEQVQVSVEFRVESDHAETGVAHARRSEPGGAAGVLKPCRPAEVRIQRVGLVHQVGQEQIGRAVAVIINIGCTAATDSGFYFVRISWTTIIAVRCAIAVAVVLPRVPVERAVVAQVGLAGGLDRELRAKNIRVSTICPGGTATEFAMGAGRTPDMPGLADMMRPENIADAIVTVLSQPKSMRTLIWSMRSIQEDD